MNRRTFLRATATVPVVATAGAGCLGGGDATPTAILTAVELENHRPEDGYDFEVRIDDAAGSVVLEETYRLGAAGSGTDAEVLARPVEDPGRYAVRVAAGEHSATGDAATFVSESQRCLRMQFYLSKRSVHVDHRTYDRCER